MIALSYLILAISICLVIFSGTKSTLIFSMGLQALIFALISLNLDIMYLVMVICMLMMCNLASIQNFKLNTKTIPNKENNTLNIIIKIFFIALFGIFIYYFKKMSKFKIILTTLSFDEYISVFLIIIVYILYNARTRKYEK